MNKSFREICLEKTGKANSEGRCLIIGEVAQSHDGSLGMAHAFIDAIANAGADAVKFQTHIAAEESTPGEPWRVKFSKQDETRFEYWRRMEFTKAQWQGLKQHADEKGLLFLSTPFSEKAVNWLSEIGMQVWKMASGEIGNLPMLNQIINTKSPIILSSGMSDWDELDKAVETIKSSENSLAVLQCTSAYPCPPEKVGLNMLEVLRRRYDCAVGLSDHSGNIFAGLAAVTLGAEVLEIHVALSREMFGPDVPASVTTDELRKQVEGIRQIEKMIEHPVNKTEMAEELAPLRNLFTKSIVASSDLSEGTILTHDCIKFKKPGTGMPPSQVNEIIGKKLQRSLKADEILSLHDVAH